MTTLYQYCNACRTERNFDPETMKCKSCNKSKANEKDCKNSLHE